MFGDILRDSLSRTHPLLHAGDNEPQVCAHLLFVCVLLLNALLKMKEEKMVQNLIIHVYIHVKDIYETVCRVLKDALFLTYLTKRNLGYLQRKTASNGTR